MIYVFLTFVLRKLVDFYESSRVREYVLKKKIIFSKFNLKTWIV